MNDIYKRALTGAAFGAAYIGYGLAASQNNETDGRQICDQTLLYATSILVAGATITLVGSAIGCVTQLLGAYNHYKNAHRNEPVVKKPLLEMETRDTIAYI